MLRLGPLALFRLPAVAGALVIVVAAVAGVAFVAACPSSTSALAIVNGSVEATGDADAAVAFSRGDGVRRQLALAKSTSAAPSTENVLRAWIPALVDRWFTPLRYLNQGFVVGFFARAEQSARLLDS
ncbi:MAG TPA: hypothetical protein PKA58_04240, partial [Polyangium sp.]|nr:hypothetical protein [Polyangium sp.]